MRAASQTLRGKNQRNANHEYKVILIKGSSGRSGMQKQEILTTKGIEGEK